MIKEAIAKVVSRNDLTEKEMMEAMEEIMTGGATAAQIGSFITALRMKGETVDEISGAARVMRAKANTIRGNNHAVNIDRDEIYVHSGSPSVLYCDVEGGWAGVGNIDADPLFAEAAIQDYHILRTSPCRDTGWDGAAGLPDEDFEGDPRPFLTADMGADEFHYHLYHLGDLTPGGWMDLKFVGPPGNMVGLCASVMGVFEPIPTAWGNWLRRPCSRARPQPRSTH